MRATRILIVDDNSRVRTALRLCIQMNPSWEVCGEAANGKDAVEMVQQLDPDVVLLDYAMPTMNGLEAARAITSVSSRQPVMILFTMFGSHELTALAQRAGVRAVISKGVGGVNELIRAIAELTSEAA